MLVNYLAEIWGILIVIISLAFLVKETNLKKLFASIEIEESFFMWGFVSLVTGLAMVLSYNVWTLSWQVIITIFGWLAILKGLSLLFFPELVKKWTKKIENSQFLPYALMVFLIIGLIITYFGFTA